MGSNVAAPGRPRRPAGRRQTGDSGAVRVLPTRDRDAPRSTPTRRSGDPPAPLYVIAANRIAYGPSPELREEWNALGATDDARLGAYVDQQLHPGALEDSEYLDRRDRADFASLWKPLDVLWQHHHLGKQGDHDRSTPLVEAELDFFLRAVHSRRQLQLRLTEFWLDHFNIYGWDYWSKPVWTDWVRLLRDHALGNFRTLLHAVARHPAMLYYLDNQDSTVAGPNENWARELMERHTLGAENYWGVVPWQEVAVDADGVPLGYCDDDVYEATRAFTGWTVANGRHGRPDTGAFHYEAESHDRFQKIFLGRFLAADQPPLLDGNDVLDALADHPGTARHIAGKLCRRLVSDHPSQQLVDAAAEAFHGHRDEPFQLRRTVAVILRSEEFRSTWGGKVKRPFEIAAGALRASGFRLDFAPGADDLSSFLWRYDHAGQPLFAWPAPDGYPDVAEKWESSTPRVMSWRLLLWMAGASDEAKAPRLPGIAHTPPVFRSARAVTDYWIERLLARPLPEAERQAVLDFMAQGFHPEIDLDWSDSDTTERLRSMIALILSTPAFLEK